MRIDRIAVSMPQLTTSHSNRQGELGRTGGAESPCPPDDLDRSTARDEVDQEHDQRNHQQQVDQAAGDMKDSPTQEPGDQQDDCKPYQHGNSSAKVICTISLRPT